MSNGKLTNLEVFQWGNVRMSSGPDPRHPIS